MAAPYDNELSTGCERTLSRMKAAGLGRVYWWMIVNKHPKRDKPKGPSHSSQNPLMVGNVEKH